MQYENFIKKAGLDFKNFRTAFAFENDSIDNISNKEAANFNAHLVVKGWKTATVTSVENFKLMPETLINDREFDIVLDGDGTPVAAIQFTKAEKFKFFDVTEEFARKDGESENIRQWRALARSFFEEQGKFSLDMDIVCLEFRKIYPKN
jgi:uncharacterized protein YhfF